MLKETFWKVLLISGVISFTVSTAFAQVTTLEGTVSVQTEDGTIKPVSEAQVDIYRSELPGHWTVKTDTSGRFKRAGVPISGKYVIAVSGPGISPVVLGVTSLNTFLEVLAKPGDGKRLSKEEVTAQTGIKIWTYVRDTRPVSTLSSDELIARFKGAGVPKEDRYEAAKEYLRRFPRTGNEELGSVAGSMAIYICRVEKPGTFCELTGNVTLSLSPKSVLASAPASKFPIKFSRTDDFGDFHMISTGTISNDGKVRIRTETNNHVALKGNCGTVAFWFLDANDNVLGATGGDQFCVDGKAVLFAGPSRRFDDLEITLSPEVFERVASVSALHGIGGKDVVSLIKANIEKAKEIKNKITDLLN